MKTTLKSLFSSVEECVHVALFKATSRKFLLAAAAAMKLLAERQYPAAAAVVLTYVGVQGAIDHKGA